MIQQHSEMFGTVLYHPDANANVLSMSVVSTFGRVVYSHCQCGY